MLKRCGLSSAADYKNGNMALCKCSTLTYYIQCNNMYHSVNIALNGIVVTDIYLVQVDGVVNVIPHVVVTLDMVVKSTSPAFKFVTWKTANETH